MLDNLVADGGGHGVYIGAAAHLTAGTLQTALQNTPAHAKELQVHQAQQEVAAALAEILTPKEVRVIRLRYGLDDGAHRSIRECGEMLGMTKDAVRGLCSRAFRKLKETERGLALLDFAQILDTGLS